MHGFDIFQINRWGWLGPAIGVIILSLHCVIACLHYYCYVTYVILCYILLEWHRFIPIQWWLSGTHSRAHAHTCTHAHTFNHVCIIVFITNICSSECCSFESTTAMNNCSSSSSSSYWREWSVNVSPSGTPLHPLHQAQWVEEAARLWPWSVSASGERCLLCAPKGYCLYFQERLSLLDVSVQWWIYATRVPCRLATMVQCWNMDWNSYCI